MQKLPRKLLKAISGFSAEDKMTWCAARLPEPTDLRRLYSLLMHVNGLTSAELREARKQAR